jgi:hypothetical protein
MMHKPAQVGLTRLQNELVLVSQEYVTVNHRMKLPLSLEEILFELLVIGEAQENPLSLIAPSRDVVKGTRVFDS